MLIDIYGELATIPPFNPDLEKRLPDSVLRLCDRIIASSVVLIASPEYAHGVSGVMKNALDWMVGNESFVYKPVAVLNTSPRASIAHSALLETLTTMSAQIVHDACITLPLLGSHSTEDALVADQSIVEKIRGALHALQIAIGDAER